MQLVVRRSNVAELLDPGGHEEQPPRFEMIEGIDPARETFRRTVRDRLAALTLRTGGAAHEINNPCASVTANLSYLTLRAEDMQAQLELLASGDIKAALSEVHKDLCEVVQESTEALRRIADLTRSLAQPSLRHTRRSEAIAPVDVGPIARRAVRLLGQCVDVQIMYRGDSTQITAPSSVICDLVLNMLIAGLEDGTEGRRTRTPTTVEVEAFNDGGEHVIKVTRQGSTSFAPRLEVELTEAGRLIDLLEGDLDVHSISRTSYAIIARIPD